MGFKYLLSFFWNMVNLCGNKDIFNEYHHSSPCLHSESACKG